MHRLILYVAIISVLGIYMELRMAAVSPFYESIFYTTNSVTQGKIITSEEYWVSGASYGSVRARRIAYTYEVDGRLYRGKRVSNSPAVDNVDHFLTMYPVGAIADVWYDEDNPSVSTLNNDEFKIDYIAFLVAFLLAAALITYWIVPGKKKDRWG